MAQSPEEEDRRERREDAPGGNETQIRRRGNAHHRTAPADADSRMEALLLLFGGFLGLFRRLLHPLFGPWRRDAVHARVRDGLAEMLVLVDCDREKDAPIARVAPEYLHGL